MTVKPKYETKALVKKKQNKTKKKKQPQSMLTGLKNKFVLKLKNNRKI